MTSASVPISSAPASSQHSFLVHLQSLTGFSQELRTQVEGIGKPTDRVVGMIADPPAFGPFSEAGALTSLSHQATAAMHGLLDDVRSAMQFADDVTRSVATGYREADDDVAWGLGGRAPIGTVVNAVTAPLAGAGATTGVGGITAGLTNTVPPTIDHAVQHTGALPGGHAVEPTVEALAATGRHTLLETEQNASHAARSILGTLTGRDGGR